MLILSNILNFISGARRWFNRQAVHGLAAVGGVLALAVVFGLGSVLIYGAGGAAKEAVVNWRWLYKLSRASEANAKINAEKQRRAAQAAASELSRAREALRSATEARIQLERELAAMKSNPQLYTFDERKRLFK